MTVILQGWSEDKSSVPALALPFYNQQGGLTAQNGIIFRGERVVIPAKLHEKMKQKVHSSHIGTEACLRRVWKCIFWPGMSAEMKHLVESCMTCRNMIAHNRDRLVNSSWWTTTATYGRSTSWLALVRLPWSPSWKITLPDMGARALWLATMVLGFPPESLRTSQRPGNSSTFRLALATSSLMARQKQPSKQLNSSCGNHVSSSWRSLTTETHILKGCLQAGHSALWPEEPEPWSHNSNSSTAPSTRPGRTTTPAAQTTRNSVPLLQQDC